MARQKIEHYLDGAEMCAEIWKSKLSFCSSLDPIPDAVMNCDFAYSGEEMPTDMTGYVRIFTHEHIPANNGSRAGRYKNATHVQLPFRPFKIYHDGKEIVRSHWHGGFENGHFDAEGGRLTNRLGRELMVLVAHYGRKSNWSGYSYNDEMQATGLATLVRGILQFDDDRGNNAFAYATTVLTNAFIKVLNDEKAEQRLRDKMLVEAGLNPSFSYDEAA